MTHEKAAALEQWIKDDDTRFEASATADNARQGRNEHRLKTGHSSR